MKSYTRFYKGLLIHFLTIVILYNVLLSLFFFAGKHTIGWHSYIYIQNFSSHDLLTLLLLVFVAEYTYYLYSRVRKLPVLLCGATGAVLAFTLLFQVLPGSKEHNLVKALEPGTVAAGYVLLYTLLHDLFYQRVLLTRQRNAQLETELKAITSQVNPHFFFNTLNHLYGLALKENALQTAEVIDQLALMMRYSLESINQPYVPLSEELAFLSHYITLQSARLPVAVRQRIHIQFPSPSDKYSITPMLLIPFVENTFVYGVPLQQDGHITIKAAITNNALHFHCENTISDKGKAAAGGTGQGTKLTLKRLALQYPGRFQFNAGETEGIYTIHLILNL